MSTTSLWTADIWYGIGAPHQPPAARIRYSRHDDGSGSAELPATGARWETPDGPLAALRLAERAALELLGINDAITGWISPAGQWDKRVVMADDSPTVPAVEAVEVSAKVVHRCAVIDRCPRPRTQDGQLDLFEAAT